MGAPSASMNDQPSTEFMANDSAFSKLSVAGSGSRVDISGLPHVSVTFLSMHSPLRSLITGSIGTSSTTVAFGEILLDALSSASDCTSA